MSLIRKISLMVSIFSTFFLYLWARIRFVLSWVSGEFLEGLISDFLLTNAQAPIFILVHYGHK